MHSRIAFALLAGTAAVAATGARATTSTANMNVSIQITAGCNVSVTPISFGSLPASTLASAQTSTVGMGGLFTYTCSNSGTTPALTAGQGNNYSASTNHMKGGTSGGLIPYTLNLPAIVAFTGAAQTAQITATIPAQTTLPAVDSYSDTVVLTLTY